MAEEKKEEFPSYVPHRVKMAQEFLFSLLFIEACVLDSVKTREPSKEEEKVKKQALECLSMYFTGEMNYGDRPPNYERPEQLTEKDLLQNELKNLKEQVEELEKALK